MKQVYLMYDREQSTPEPTFHYCPRCATALLGATQDGVARPLCPACGFVQFRNPAPAVTVLVTNGKQVLLGQRSGNPGAGLWALPSGYVEYDEDFLSGARREVQEETGLETRLQAIVNVESAFLTPRYHFLTVYLLAEPVGGKLCAGDDLVAVAWFPGAGSLPEMAFVQDVALITAHARGELVGMPVDPDFAGRRAN